MENKHWTCLGEIFKAIKRVKIRHAKLPNNDFRLCQKINYAVSLNVLFCPPRFLSVNEKKSFMEVD